MNRETKVLVVDDSAYMRKVLSGLLEGEPGIKVIDTARDGLDALEKIKLLKPDVVTLDIEMPKMDGLTALKRIMEETPTAVVMVSSLTQESSETTMKALSLGAVDFVPKPSGAISLDIYKVKEEMIHKVKTASKVSLQKVRQNRVSVREIVKTFPPISENRQTEVRASKVVFIGSSTGGPGALQQVVPNLPQNLDAGVLIVQHMPPGFTQSLAKRLNDISLLAVKEAERGDIILKDHVYIAPGGYHMVVRDTGVIDLNQDPPQHSVRPAADVTLESLVKVYGKKVVGVILTGMGFDGARGMGLLKKAGGKTIAQDESTSIVYGMPKVVVEMGNADSVLPINQIAQTIVEFIKP